MAMNHFISTAGYIIVISGLVLSFFFLTFVTDNVSLIAHAPLLKPWSPLNLYETSALDVRGINSDARTLALVISGQMRTFHHVYESIARHLVYPTIERGHKVDIFLAISLPLDDVTREETIARVQRFNTSCKGMLRRYLLYSDTIIEGSRFGPKFNIGWMNTKLQSILQQMRGWQIGYELAIEHERQYPLPYDFIARIRTDMWWVKDVPDIATFPLHVPTLPRSYTSTVSILNGCIDDKILFFPRNISQGFFNALEYYGMDKTWTGVYDFLTDIVVDSCGMSILEHGSRHDLSTEKCGNMILAPFNYVEFATTTLRDRNPVCFEAALSDFWSGYSDFCPKGATGWQLPANTTWCYACDSTLCKQCP